MVPPIKYQDAAARNAARSEQRRQYAKSERGKVTKSAQNRAAYRRHHGRRGSPVIPFIHPMIAYLAKEPVPLTPLACLIFHTPKLVMSDPLNCKTILHLSEGPNPVQSDIIHGLYLRYEHDIQEEHLSRFNSGDIINLQNDVGRVLRVVLKMWVELWDKEMARELYTDTNDEQETKPFHLSWVSRIADGFRSELFLLGTVQRRQEYVASLTARRVKVPNA